MSEHAAITEHAEGTVLAVIVVPRAGKTGFDRVGTDTVRIRLAAAPVDGAANAALLRYLADVFDLPRNRVRLLTGATSRRKRILLVGLSPKEVAARISHVTGDSIGPSRGVARGASRNVRQG
jgi:uncharacterized protein YggU (UPF0235/DUF167 family)